jgi:uncharacterized protein (DUF58 family)
LGESTPVHIDIANGGAIAIRAWVMDYAAPSLLADVHEQVVSIRPGETAGFEYEARPRERGDVEVGIVALRYRSGGMWPLAERWATVPLRQSVRVYPEFARASQPLSLVQTRHAAPESRRTRSLGLGREFEDLREFQPGDELRDICWTATARRGRLVTKRYQAERNQTVWLVLDAGRLMRARIDGRSRLDRNASAAFSLAQAVSAAGDRTALLAYGRTVQHQLAPGRGSVHLRAMLEALATVRAEAAEADHARAALIVRRLQQRRALVVWLTDLAESASLPEVVESAAALMPYHVVVLAVMQHRELAEAAAAIPADGRRMYLALAALEMLERRALALQHLRRQGAAAVEVAAEELAAQLIDRYRTVKSRNLL